ncbi:lytic murein transglycosylase [Vibrio sp. CAU 1672]|uniref:lytic murein transglycosylase n=1 Tax=Vibrio sp. CAU 1672 TaxID=3032594 RepID=UPI0023D9F8A7|nr:lytic murein transglycosylase [Vibrio sp. CAU 1672]MDF2155293.1 lytic murein transglycosylase [Vibrio sp. CAU 1672]
MKTLLATMLSIGVCCSALAADEGFEAYLDKLRAEARDKGISEQTISAAFANVEYKPRAVTADRNQPEKRLTLDEYIPRAVPDWKVEQAKALYQTHQQELARIGAYYGVQPRFIVALWGVESNFGKFTGNFRVIDALSTLAFEGRREAFFRGETMAALEILDQGHIELDNFKGSWAGAMGQCQFMPSSFLRFAADGNGDGRKDIWQSQADVFASTANYLSESGWDDSYTWGRQVKVPKGINPALQGREADQGKYLQQWSQLGITKYDGSPLPKLDKDIKAWLIMPDDENGRTYLVYNNYNVLMKWNRSYYFALAVSHLADRIID